MTLWTCYRCGFTTNFTELATDHGLKCLKNPRHIGAPPPRMIADMEREEAERLTEWEKLTPEERKARGRKAIADLMGD